MNVEGRSCVSIVTLTVMVFQQEKRNMIINHSALGGGGDELRGDQKMGILRKDEDMKDLRCRKRG